MTSDLSPTPWLDEASRSNWVPKHLDLVAVGFVVSLLVSNLAAQKLFTLGPATFSAGILVFPLSYIIGDVLAEVYGFARARRIIYAGLIANLFMALVLWVAIKLPPAPGWPLQDQFAAIHSLVPRVVAASIAGYLIGELSNALVLSRLKVKMSGRHLWIRTIASTVVGQFLDSGVFVFVAFAGVFETQLLLAAWVSSWAFKVAYEAAATPLTYVAVAKLKAAEGVDYYDTKEDE